MAKCGICGEDVTRSEIFNHRKDVHGITRKNPGTPTGDISQEIPDEKPTMPDGATGVQGVILYGGQTVLANIVDKALFDIGGVLYTRLNADGPAILVQEMRRDAAGALVPTQIKYGFGPTAICTAVGAS